MWTSAEKISVIAANLVVLVPALIFLLKKTKAVILWELFLELQKIRKVTETNSHELKQNGGSSSDKVGTLKDVAVETKKETEFQSKMLAEIKRGQDEERDWREQVKKDLIKSDDKLEKFSKEIRGELGTTNVAFAHLVVHMSRGSLMQSRLLEHANEVLAADEEAVRRFNESQLTRLKDGNKS